MDSSKASEVRQWLIKAEHDLQSAKRLMDGEPPLLDTAVYHCQQVAEKSLKAYLALNDVPIIFSAYWSSSAWSSTILQRMAQNDEKLMEIQDSFSI